MTTGQYELYVSPTILNKRWEGEDPELGDERISDFDERICASIIEEMDMYYEDDARPVTYKILNTQERNEQEPVELFCFGEPENIQKLIEGEVGFDSELIVITNDPTTYEAIKSSVPQIQSQTFKSDNLINSDLNFIREQNRFHAVLKAAILEQRITHGFDDDTRSVDVLGDTYKNIPVLKGSAQSVESALLEQRNLELTLGKIAKNGVPEITRSINNAAQNLANKSYLTIKEEDVNQNLPFVRSDAIIEKRDMALDTLGGLSPATIYFEVIEPTYSHESSDPSERLLAASIENSDGSLSFYNSPELIEQLLKNSVKPTLEPEVSPERNMQKTRSLK